jgi:hypothetical protein
MRRASSVESTVYVFQAYLGLFMNKGGKGRVEIACAREKLRRR